MNDYEILNDLFRNEYDEISFKLFKTVKIIGINNTIGVIMTNLYDSTQDQSL